MEILGFAQVKKVAPKLKLATAKTACDLDTLQAVITHRYEVLAKFAKSLRKTYAVEMRALRLRAGGLDLSRVKRLLQLDAKDLHAQERARLAEVLSHSKALHTAYSMREELAVEMRALRLRAGGLALSRVKTTGAQR